MAATRLVRDPERAMLGGVCAGLARQFDLDVTVVRIVMVLLVFVGGSGIAIYLAAWLLMPAPGALDKAPVDVARENADDVVAAARRTVDTIRHANTDELTGQARRAAHEVERVATDAVRTAREALSRDSRGGRSNGTPSNGADDAARAAGAVSSEVEQASTLAEPEARTDWPAPPPAAGAASSEGGATSDEASAREDASSTSPSGGAL